MIKTICIPFHDGHNYIVIEDTRGCMEALLKSHVTEHIGYGSGDTPLEAAERLIESVRRTADDMEAAVAKWKSENYPELRTDD